jgi:xylulokinase
MPEEHLIGVDIGVSFIKVGVYDTDGSCKANVTKPNPGHYPEQDIFIQSSEEMVEIIISSLKEAVEKSGIKSSTVAAIGFSGAMGGLMGVDKNLEPVAEWSIVSDMRYNRYASEFLLKAERKIMELSGSNFAVFGPKILWWKNDYPAIYSRVIKFMGICGFVICRLGRVPAENAVIDKTVTIFSGISDLKKACWSEELCKEFGIDINLLPKIVEPATIAGYLSKDAAEMCGLLQGIPLIAGAGDKAAGNLGAGLVSPGQLIDEAATFGAFSVCTDRYVPDVSNKTLGNLPSPITGLYTPGAYLNSSGATSAWFADVFATEEKKESQQKNLSVFKILDENASKIPAGSDGLFSISLLSGRLSPGDPDIKGLYIGHGLMHTKEHFYRAMLESFAYEYAFYLNAMKKNYPELKFDEVMVMGGGAKSDFYNQIKSDVLGIPYVRLARDDFALLGDILIAGNAVGIFKDLKQAAQKFSVKTKRYIPDEKNHSFYKKYTDFNAGIYDRVRGIYTDLKNMSLSK